MREELQPETLQVIDAPAERDDVDATTGCEGGAPSDGRPSTTLPDADGTETPLDESVKDAARLLGLKVKRALSFDCD